MIPFLQTAGQRRKRLARIRFVACDLDGTLLTDDNEVTAATMELIGELRGAGIEIILLSGRSHAFVQQYARLIGSAAPVVSLNGGLIIAADGALLDGSFLRREVCETICDAAGRHPDTAVAAFAPDGIFHESPAAQLPRYLRAVPSEMKRVTSIAPYFGTSALLVVTGTYAAVQDVVRTIAKRYKDELTRGYYQSGMGEDRFYLEIRNGGISKGSALAMLARHYAVGRRAFAAIGDFDNDIEMCRFAGVSAATRNAVDSLKNLVDIVTRNTNNEGAAAEFFQLLLDARRS